MSDGYQALLDVNTTLDGSTQPRKKARLFKPDANISFLMKTQQAKSGTSATYKLMEAHQAPSDTNISFDGSTYPR